MGISKGHELAKLESCFSSRPNSSQSSITKDPHFCNSNIRLRSKANKYLLCNMFHIWTWTVKFIIVRLLNKIDINFKSNYVVCYSLMYLNFPTDALVVCTLMITEAFSSSLTSAECAIDIWILSWTYDMFSFLSHSKSGNIYQIPQNYQNVLPILNIRTLFWLLLDFFAHRIILNYELCTWLPQIQHSAITNDSHKVHASVISSYTLLASSLLGECWRNSEFGKPCKLSSHWLKNFFYLWPPFISTSF